MSALAALVLAATAPVPGTCALPPGWNAIAERRSRYVIFGEIHGTVQSPALVGAIACALARKGERVLVAIEQSSSDDAALQAAWALPDARFGEEVRRTGWAGRDDGVASEAMYALPLGLHRLRDAGRPISVVAFNGTEEQELRPGVAALPGQGPHEEAQAKNIRAAAAHGQYDRVLILVGNLHARKQPVIRGSVTYEPMAMRLAPPAEITSLNMRDAGGTMWNCMLRPGYAFTQGRPLPDGAIDCSDHPTDGPALDLPTPSVGLGDVGGKAPDPAYDGYYWLGRMTGSPPLLPAPEKPAAK